MSMSYEVNKFPLEVEDYFPFEPRAGQTLMANEIYYGILSKNHIAIEGAAGLGKTVTCLSALLPICKREGLTLLYAARTHSQMRRVIEELNTICKKKNRQITGVTLQGRTNMCLNPRVRNVRSLEAMDLCRILRRDNKCRWYERLKVKELGKVSGCFSSDYLVEYGRKSLICPYFLGKKLIQYCDVIALTYVYLINPHIRRLFLNSLNQNLNKCVIVFDECHNVPQLTMNAMSTSISSRGLTRAIHEYERYDLEGKFTKIKSLLSHFATYLNELSRAYGTVDGEEEIPIDKQTIINYLFKFTSEFSLDLYMFSQKVQQFGRMIIQKKLEARSIPYSSIHHFGLFLERFIHTIKDPKYLHYAIISNTHIHYYIRCLDCRLILEPLKDAYSIISMSGTLEPIKAYLDICGFPETTRQKVLPSPFNHNNLRVFCVKGINTTYFNRSARLYNLLAQRCAEVVNGSIGNTAIFCASYDILESFQRKFSRLMRGVSSPLYFEQRNWSSRDNEDMIAQFKEDGRRNKKAVLIGVCGGRNSEGVDFPGSEMMTVVILGIPLARINHSTNALIDYYTRQFGIFKGKEYAYTIPGVRRANQAAGRPIRRLEDSGVIVLLDERYSYPYYRRFLSHWLSENMVFLRNKEGVLGEAVSGFFRKLKKEQEKEALK